MWTMIGQYTGAPTLDVPHESNITETAVFAGYGCFYLEEGKIMPYIYV